MLRRKDTTMNKVFYVVMGFAMGLGVCGCGADGPDTNWQDGGQSSDGDADSDSDGDADADADGDSDGDTDGDSDGDSDGDADADTDTDADGDVDGDSDGDTDGDADGDTDGDADGPTPSDLPSATGTCPEFTAGDVTFSPTGLNKSRKARIWISNAADTMDGPLVFYWHGTGSSPTMEVPAGLGNQAINQIRAMGGIIVAPYHDPDAGTYPWYLVGGNRTDDLVLADEVLACAIEKVGVDTSRIHTLGMSAGGLHTAQMSFRRSNYIASAVTYSGGISFGKPPDKELSNKFAAMIFHGGPDDVVVISFQQASNTYKTQLTNSGRFAFICNHGNGHNIPMAATGSVWQFFQDHPWGTTPFPYESGLPAGFPAYCEL